MKNKIMLLYDISLFTGTFSTPIHPPKVCVTIVGERVSFKRLPLSNVGTGQCAFYPGSTHTFSIRCGHLGNISSIILEITQSQHDIEWFVNAVTISCPSLKVTWGFPCYSWFSSKSPNRTLIREIKGQAHYKNISLTLTVVWNYNGKDFLFQLLGNEGCSTQILLKYPKPASADNSCVYALSLPCLGRMQKGIISSLDGEFINVAYVRVDESDKSNGCAYFFYEDKNVRLTPGLITSTICPAVNDINISKKDVRYVVTFETGGKQMQELTSTPFVQLRENGIFGRRHWIENALTEHYPYTTHARKCVQKNVFGHCTRVRVHLLPSPHVEEITAVRVGHDNSGQYPHWNLKTVKIEDPINVKVYQFTFNKWVSKTKGIKNTVVELKATMHKQLIEN